jgi:hypothetical protein
LAKEVRSRYSSIDCSHYTMDIQCEAAGGLSILSSDHRQRKSDQGIVIDTGHHTMDTQCEAAGGLSILPSDHWQRWSDQGTVDEVQLSMISSF